MFFYILFYHIIKVKTFLYCFIILLRLIFSFLHIRSLFAPYVYVSIKSVDCIVLSAFELKAMLLIFSVKTLCLSFSNIFCVFNISLLFLRIIFDLV